MAQAPRQQPPARREQDGPLPGLRDVSGLPLRVGRHLTAWLVWHTARVSLVSDVPPGHPRES